jgi:hypothetical protein
VSDEKPDPLALLRQALAHAESHAANPGPVAAFLGIDPEVVRARHTQAAAYYREWLAAEEAKGGTR